MSRGQRNRKNVLEDLFVEVLVVFDQHPASKERIKMRNENERVRKLKLVHLCEKVVE